MTTSRTMLALLCSLAAPLLMAHAAAAQVAIKAKTIHTMGPTGTITDGVIVLRDGKVAAVGPAASTAIPEGFRVLQAAVATPGLIDARSTVGLSGIYNQRHDSDQLERSSPIQPELRALDAYNPQEPLVAFIRELGVTTVNTGHAPGELVSGQTIIVKTVGNTVEAALVKNPGSVVATLDPSAEKDGRGSPGTRAKMVSMLREQFIRAREYETKWQRHRDKLAGKAEPAKDQTKGDADTAKEKDKEPPAPPERNLRLEMMSAVLRGEIPMLITADRAHDIDAALRLADEFGFKMILDSGSEAYERSEQLKARNIPVFAHAPMVRYYGDRENGTFELPAILQKAGIPFAIQSGYEAYVPKTRVVLFEAAVAAANGLTFDQALASITITPAKLLGIDARVGSIETGKDGDVALYNGDPFEYTTHCVGVVINGNVVSEKTK